VIKFFTFLLALPFICLSAQTKIYIVNVETQGLELTKENVVLNELDFKIGDSLDMVNLATILERNEKRLLSTGLFTLANINIKKWNEVTNKVEILLSLKENWYIYPAPIFELADRSFNVWIKEMNADFDRVNYGIRLDHLNTTGRKDKLKLKLQAGYTKKYEVDYNIPYIHNNWGLGFNIVFSENKELGYKTIGNKIVFKKYADERILLKKSRYGISGSNRFSAYGNQVVKLEYYHNRINDVVVNELNKNYFPDGANYIKYLKLEYILKYNHTVFPTYPEGGYAYAIEIKKEGLGFGNYNNLSLATEYERYTKVGKHFIMGGKIKVKKNLLGTTLPYSNNFALGYGNDIIRGYELYVIDGDAFYFGKSVVKMRLLDKKWKLGKYMPVSAFNVLPLRAFFKFVCETGYAHEGTYTATNTLNNKWLIGYGPGIDLMLYNNFQLSLEYSFNHLGESNVFYKSSFNF
jgi:outer membrane protein assembly factor BamA